MRSSRVPLGSYGKCPVEGLYENRRYDPEPTVWIALSSATPYDAEALMPEPIGSVPCDKMHTPRNAGSHKSLPR